MSWEGLNRRQFPRANFPCLVKIVLNGAPAAVLLTHTENVSTGGFCVILRKSLERFTLVDVEIDLMDGGEHVTCRGKAVWVIRRKATDPVKPSFYDIGIEYVDIKNEVRDRIGRVVDHIAKHQNKAVI